MGKRNTITAGVRTVIFKNNLCSLECTEENRLTIYDSDDEYIDYFCQLDELDEDVESTVEYYRTLLQGKNERELSNFLCGLECVKDKIPNCSKEHFKCLYKEYGKEFINRIGNTAIIIRE